MKTKLSNKIILIWAGTLLWLGALVLTNAWYIIETNFVNTTQTIEKIFLKSFLNNNATWWVTLDWIEWKVQSNRYCDFGWSNCKTLTQLTTVTETDPIWNAISWSYVKLDNVLVSNRNTAFNRWPHAWLYRLTGNVNWSEIAGIPSWVSSDIKPQSLCNGANKLVWIWGATLW